MAAANNDHVVRPTHAHLRAPGPEQVGSSDIITGCATVAFFGSGIDSASCAGML
jgi:hypothetical protein